MTECHKCKVGTPLYGAERKTEFPDDSSTYSFHMYMETHLEDNTPIGDLARDMYADYYFPPWAAKYENLRDYLEFKEADHRVLDAFEEAYALYSKEVN